MATALVAAERVRAALDVLPAEQRRAIQLAYFEGKTYRQVAEVLGHPRGHGEVPTAPRPPPYRRRTRSRRSRVVTPRPELTPDDVAELLGAYALDACSARGDRGDRSGARASTPTSADEAMRLARAASWIGATETARAAGVVTQRRRVHASRAPRRARRPTARSTRYLSLSAALARRDRRAPRGRARRDHRRTGSPPTTSSCTWRRRRACSRRRPASRRCPELQETDIDGAHRRAASRASTGGRVDDGVRPLAARGRRATARGPRATSAAPSPGAASAIDARRRDRHPRLRDVDPHRRPPPRRRVGSRRRPRPRSWR